MPRPTLKWERKARSLAVFLIAMGALFQFVSLTPIVPYKSLIFWGSVALLVVGVIVLLISLSSFLFRR